MKAPNRLRISPNLSLSHASATVRKVRTAMVVGPMFDCGWDVGGGRLPLVNRTEGGKEMRRTPLITALIALVAFAAVLAPAAMAKGGGTTARSR